MTYPSHFNVVQSCGDGCRVFGLVNKRAYRFPFPWNEIVQASSADAELESALTEAGLLSRHKGYLEQVDAYLEKLRRDDDKNLVVYFCVTGECGVGCPYCFQNHTRRRAATPALVERFLDLLERRLSNGPPVPLLYLVLFGGEPIRRKDLCLRILEGATNACARHGVPWRTHLAANGISETDQVLRPLISAGLTGIQVTFDGPKAAHERTRGHSYEIILEKLAGYASCLFLGIKYNLTRLSAQPDNMTRFFDDLARTGVPPETLLVPEAVTPTLTYRDTAFIYPSYSTELPAAYLRFCGLAAESQFQFSFSSAFHPPCFLRRRNVVEITPDGHLTMCENAPEVSAFDVGSLETLGTLTPDKPHVVEAIRASVAKGCAPKRCPFFPICESGCFLEKHLLGLPFTEPCCHQDYYRGFFPSLFDLVPAGGRGPSDTHPQGTGL